MNGRKFLGVASLAVGVGLGGGAFAQDAIDLGQREFETHCAACHGVTGKGAGVLEPFLRVRPPDLTQLSLRNFGVFPLSRLYESIEGVGEAAHGSREMPIWGQRYRVLAEEDSMDLPYNAELYARTRILALLEYLGRLQRQ